MKIPGCCPLSIANRFEREKTVIPIFDSGCGQRFDRLFKRILEGALQTVLVSNRLIFRAPKFESVGKVISFVKMKSS